MAYNTKSQIEAVEAVIPRLYKEIYVPVAEPEIEVFLTPEPVSFENKTAGERKTVKKGEVWGNPWDCGWFHITCDVPKEASEKKLVLYMDIHGEMCVFDKNGVPVRGITSGSCLNTAKDLGCFAIRKRTLDLEGFVQNGKLDLWADGSCCFITGVKNANRPQIGKIEFADLCVCRENVKDLFYDFFVLYDLFSALSKESARRARLLNSLFKAAALLYDYSDEEVFAASQILKKELDKKCGDTDLTFSAIGHAHIDLAWLWPIRETKRKGARTFSNEVLNLEKNPDYVFGASQPQLFEWVKQDYPKLYEKIKKFVNEGRFELQGAMWVEPDVNVSGGEALVRQIIYGKKFFKEEFGKDMKILWLPDVFGYSAALPQLMKKSGVDYFMTTKLGWGNRHNKHPHQTFVWRGIDGSEVLTHMPPEGSYSSFALPSVIKKIEGLYEDKGVCGRVMMPFGIGDGGGGTGEFHLEAVKREKNLSGLHPVVQETALDFFENIAKNKKDYNTYCGELYFEMHQGTYTTQSKNKRFNRKTEYLLRETEFALVAANKPYPKEKLDKIWKEVLLYQFHDILPGSSIKRVYDESLERYKVLQGEINDILKSALGDGDFAVNSLSWERCGYFKFGEKWYKLCVPPMGSAKLFGGKESKETEINFDGVLENKSIKAVFDESGAITSVYDKNLKREILKKRSNRFAVYVDGGDGWDFPEGYRSTTPKYFELKSQKAFCDGPKKMIKQEYTFGDSTLWQTISLTGDSSILEFDTKAHWNENAKMLRTSFDTTIKTNEASCDIQFGTIKRTTHNNTSWDVAKHEICAHKYVDLSDSSAGVALINDCKYGYYAKDGVLDLNLLRSTNEPGENADRGEHSFRYALYPHDKCLEQSDVLQKSYEFNLPLQKSGEIKQLFTLSNPDIIAESVKLSEDGKGFVIRLFESKGGAKETKICFGRDIKEAYLTDLTEQNPQKADLEALKFGPFEILTLKVIPKQEI